MKYENNDITDAVGELLRDKKAKKLSRILWINIIVVGVILLLVYLFAKHAAA